ncbi:flagellar protein FlaG [Natroniella sp. ANB-PHB2]|uniref:flagellar protein FlaG n=1 Tax=Natroniella sp. ANB-PHB2 TaxID=3384444 RepID=UPI0038D4D19E
MKVSEVNSINSAKSVSSRKDSSQQENIQQSISHDLNKELDNHFEEQEREFTKENLEEGVEALNETLDSFQKDLTFELHEESDRMMVKLMDIRNDEVIKEFPPEEVLDMLGRIRQAVGLIIDEKI